MRVGIGYDVHKLVRNRKLIVGGVEIPFDKGLLGHSDADVLIHAVIDSLLGAMGKGDIGRLFPDTDDTYKDISSLVLLEKVGFLLKSENCRVENIDAVIIAQLPRLSPYMDEMSHNIARCLGIPEDLVNVKAKTEEGLGFTGSGEGIAAKAVCCIEKTKDVQFL